MTETENDKMNEEIFRKREGNLFFPILTKVEKTEIENMLKEARQQGFQKGRDLQKEIDDNEAEKRKKIWIEQGKAEGYRAGLEQKKFDEKMDKLVIEAKQE